MSDQDEKWLSERPLSRKARQSRQALDCRRLKRDGVYTRKQFRAAYKIQRQEYDWDFAKEREFMENLFCTRFNFLLVVYSLFVTAGAAAWQNRILFIAIMFCGAAVCLMVWFTVIRAFLKLDILFKILYGAFPEMPMFMVNEEAEASSMKLFRVNDKIAYYIPFMIVLSLLAGGITMLVWPSVLSDTRVQQPQNLTPATPVIGSVPR